MITTHTNTKTKTRTNAKTRTKTKTKTKTKCFKGPRYAIFFKSRGFKDIKIFSYKKLLIKDVHPRFR